MIEVLAALLSGSEAIQMIQNQSQVLVYVTDIGTNDQNLSVVKRVSSTLAVPVGVISCSEQAQFCDTITFNSFPQLVLYNGHKRMSVFVGNWKSKLIKKFVYENGNFNIFNVTDVSGLSTTTQFLLIRTDSKHWPDSIYTLSRHIKLYVISKEYNQNMSDNGYLNGGTRSIDVWLNSDDQVWKFDQEFSEAAILQWLGNKQEL